MCVCVCVCTVGAVIVAGSVILLNWDTQRLKKKDEHRFEGVYTNEDQELALKVSVMSSFFV